MDYTNGKEAKAFSGALRNLAQKHETVQAHPQPARENDHWTVSGWSASGRAVILCAGDLMCDPILAQSAYFPDSDTYDFNHCFKQIRPLLQQSDLTIGHLDTMVTELYPTSREVPTWLYGDKKVYHSNASVAFLDACRNAGFQCLTLAGNHNLDCGYDGLKDTLCQIDSRGIMRTGLFADEKDERVLLADVNGIRVGILSYTEDISWNLDRELLTEEGRRACVNRVEPDCVRSDIKTMRERGAEFILAYVNFRGEMYSHEPTQEQRKLAQWFADSGVDYILGTRSRSVQPYEELHAADGRRVPVCYSLGSFISSDNTNYSARNGVLFRLELEKNGGHLTVISESSIPFRIVEELQRSSYVVFPAEKKYRRFQESKLLDAVVEDTMAALRVESTPALEPKPDSEPGKQLPVQDVLRDNISDSLFAAYNRKEATYGGMRSGDERYSCLRYAEDSVKDCAAFLITRGADHVHGTVSDTERERLAKVAMEKGAKVLITDKKVGDYPCIIVDNAFRAWIGVHALLRSLFSPIVVGVTGSIGKTTTTQMIYHVIASKFNTHRNTSSENNFRLAGMVLQNLKREHQVYVQEIMEGPPYGSAEQIARMTRPTISVVTRVGTSHMSAFGSQERITESCFGIENGMGGDGQIIINSDDPFQASFDKMRHPVICVAINDKNAHYRAENIKNAIDHISFDIVYDNKRIAAMIHCLGVHNVYNALTSFAAGKLVGMDDAEIVRALNTFATSGIRQNLIKYGGQSIFLDCYNASGESIKGALNAVDAIHQSVGTKVVAVLADVLELGRENEVQHRLIGQHMHDSQVDTFILYGDSMRFARDVMEQSGDTRPLFWTNDFEELKTLIARYATRDKLVLVKGSHGMKLEKAVDQIFGTHFHEAFEQYEFRAHPASDEDLDYRVYTDHATVIKSKSKRKSLSIPDFVDGVPVTGIERSVFSGRTTLEDVQFPAHLVNVRYCSFYSCEGLTELTLPESLRIIERSAFNNCKQLQRVTIREGCTHIGYRAFYNCKNLESIHIPATVMQIEDEAFFDCRKLTIYGKEGSYAQEYANKHKIRFAAE